LTGSLCIEGHCGFFTHCGRRFGGGHIATLGKGLQRFWIACRCQQLQALSARWQRYTISMTQEAAELLKKALALPAEERANLASTLIDSLDATVDEHAEAAWQEEVRRRIDDLRSGRVSTVPWEEVQEKARTLLDDQSRR